MNKQFALIPFGIACLSLLPGCADQDSQSNADTDTNTDADLMLMYQESEPDIEPYMTRVLVNKQYMRLDEGADQSNYTLYDRVNNIIFTVAHQNRTIMQVRPVKTDQKIERELVLDAQKMDDAEIPSIEGRQPVHYQLKVNDKSCADVYAIKGMHEEAVEAMAGFNRILASIHLNNINNTPTDLLDDCFIAHNVVAPSRSMQFGFPILEQHADGTSRLLVDFKRNYQASPELYQLPDGYRLMNMGGSGDDTEF